ncbi:MAG TPA: hypothetical protein VN777_06440 [Terriglobales bacterium]|nr:hypothetical protein [Terriglobales bacterium]
MNRLSAPVCAIVLLVSPCTLLGQHGGRGVSTGRPPTGAPNPSTNSDITDFNRAVALQATPEQIAQFKELTKSTEAARKAAQIVIEHADHAKEPDSSLYAGLSDAVDEAQSSNLQFVRSFSTSQQSGLKVLTKKLSKANSDVSKQSKALAQELGRSKIDNKRIAPVVDKLDKALTGFQAEQFEIGKEMGIQPEEHPQ